MPVEPTAQNLLAVASYGITGRIDQLIAVHKLLDEMHGPRLLLPSDLDASDLRCKTCRNSSGKPMPWPCPTWSRFAEILGISRGPATTALFHALGRSRNGIPIRNAKALVMAVVAEAKSDEDEQPAITATAEGDIP